jgi:hypothetical protein
LSPSKGTQKTEPKLIPCEDANIVAFQLLSNAMYVERIGLLFYFIYFVFILFILIVLLVFILRGGS